MAFKIEKLKTAFGKAIDRAGNMHQLEKQTGVSSPTINRFHSGKQDIANIPFSTLIKLFPDIEISFFRDERPPPGEIDNLRREYEAKLTELERDRKQFELERENWRLKQENEELKKARAQSVLSKR